MSGTESGEAFLGAFFSSFFAPSYAAARASFIERAEAAGLAVQSHVHPLAGIDGETLALDVVRHGPADAKRLLVVSSGCHGVEGFCGSGVQSALLSDHTLWNAAQDAGVAVLYLHALNPWGFSWCRRTTHENVDFNRNWQDFAAPLPHNAAYESIAPLLLPPQWPPAPEVEAALGAYAAQHGAMALQTAITAGQYQFADGLFYGGREPTWSHRTLRQVLREHGTRCERLAWIDVHTGLGPSGHGELIFAGRDDAAAMARARAWWGAAVTSVHDGSSTSAPLAGLMFNVAHEECAQAEYTGVALEYGTEPMAEVVAALREDQWHENHPEAPAERRAAARRRMFRAFFTDTPQWKQAIVEQGLETAHRAVAGLAAAR